MKIELQKIFDKHKAYLDYMKKNRAGDTKFLTYNENLILDLSIQRLTDVLSDINQLLTSQPSQHGTDKE